MKEYSLNFRKELTIDKSVNAVIGVLFFVLAITLAAYVRIPISTSPVPVTLQTLFVMLCGATLGRKLGILSQASYIAMGCAGFPIFQGFSSGLFYVMGPTGGYLAGFVLATYLIGRLIKPERFSMWRVALVFLLGDIVIHVSGAAWLACIYGIGISKSFTLGILPFIPGEVVKISAATLIYSNIYGRVQRIF